MIPRVSELTNPAQPGDRMPVLFVGHGSPLNAIEDNAFSRAWRDLGEQLPPPRAILCVSAHWETRGVHVSAIRSPGTIHDFYGFPRELYEIQYSARGDPELANRIVKLVEKVPVRLDHTRGLDHGAWSVLRLMYPRAEVPVIQLSLDTQQPAAFHYDLGRELAPLRTEGVLVLGSGNIVHNLALMDRRRPTGYEWANEFNSVVRAKMRLREHSPLIGYHTLHPAALEAVPTPEHYLPLLYVLALQDETEPLELFNDELAMGSISMLSVRIGA
jgi:4,5-DOPA dioxygenase extradiol